MESDDIQTMKNLGYLVYSDGNSVQGIRVDVLNYTKGSYKKFVKNLQKVEEDLFYIYIEVRTKTYLGNHREAIEWNGPKINKVSQHVLRHH